MAVWSEWTWHDEVPEELRPYQGQIVRTAGVEHWMGFDFIMLDYWNRTTGRYICRYAAHPDVKFHWRVQGPNQGFWFPALPPQGLFLRMREAKWRERAKGNLVHLDDSHPALQLLYFVRCSIWGCYVAHYVEWGADWEGRP